MDRHAERLVGGFVMLTLTVTTAAVVVLLHTTAASFLGPVGYLVPSAVMLTSYGLGAIVACLTGDVP